MAFVRASCSFSDHHLLQPVLLHSQTPTVSKRDNSISLPFKDSSLAATPLNCRSRKILTISHSLQDDAASGQGSTVSVAEVDPLLAVRKKAADLPPGLKGTCIYLVGVNCTMKTSLGKLLADALRYCFFDSDGLVVDAAGGKSAARLFRTADEEGFRGSETEVLRQLSSMGRLVVSAGDGAVQSAANLALLRHGISIWVDVPLDMVAREVVKDGIQLSLSEISISGSHSEVLGHLTKMYEEMRGGYATADATVSLQKVGCQLGYDDLDAVTPEDLGLEVLKEIEKLIRVKKMMEDAARPF